MRLRLLFCIGGVLTSDDSSHFKASFRKIIISSNCKLRVVNRIIGQ